MKLSLGKKLIFGGIALVAIPLAVVGWYAYDTAAEATTKLSKDAAANTAQKLADMTQLVLAEEVKLAKELAASAPARAAAQAAGAGEASAELAALQSQLDRTMAEIGENYEVILFAGPQGQVLADGNQGAYRGISVADRAYFQTASTGKVAAGQVVRSKKTGKLLAMFGVPVKAGGQVAGVMATGLDLGFLKDKILSTRTGQTGYPFVISAKGITLLHPKDEFILELDLHNLKGMEEITRLMLAGQAGVTDYVFRGTQKIAGYAPVPLTGWSVAFTQDSDEFLGAAYSIRNGVALIAAVALAAAVLLVLVFARSITRPINQVVTGLTEASQQVAAASSQVNASSQSLAEGASEQAASLEETSSSLEELASMTRQNADHAGQADGLTTEASGIVDEANTSMSELTQSMSAITQASEEISKIVKSIDEIAFQTNLLALNAAVEAARAGEAGAGFAVVADEVRNLAMRAAEAAKNTNELIEGTVQKIQGGARLVESTNQAFQKVAESTGKVAGLVAEIAAASKEQTEGLDQINRAVSDMDKTTQTAAANAEETASASEELNGQADSMKEFVGQLVAVVGGAGGDGNGRSAGPRRVSRPGAGPKALPAPRRRGDSGQGGSPSAGQAGSRAAGESPKARREIPLEEDDKDFADF
jgi:methyl-accepting chemotaxis protein